MSNNIYRYYVYAYLRSNGTPYYIGKGCNRRAYKKHRHIPVPKDKSRIVFLETNLSNVGACALERRYIEWYGRKDLGTGILRNMTDGGEGGDGHVHSEETRARLSVANTGKNISSETRVKISVANTGKKRSSEAIARMSAAQKGKSMPLETKAKISATQKSKLDSPKDKTNPMYGKTHTQQSKNKIGEANRKNIGEKNSQYGTMWISNGVVNKKIKKNEIIPDGWIKRRVFIKNADPRKNI